MSRLSSTNLSLDLSSRPAGTKSKAKLRCIIFSLFLCAVHNRALALSTYYVTTPRSIGYRIPTVPTDVAVGFPKIGHQRIDVCLLATKEKLKDETDGKGNMGDPRVYSPVSQITVGRADEEDSSAENCAGDDIILQRNIQYEGDEDEDEETIAKRRAAIRLAIDLSNKKPNRSRSFTERKTGRNKTSVGPKRIGSASRARKTAGRTRTGIPAKILSGLQSTAGAAVHKKNMSSAPRTDEDLEKFREDNGEIRREGNLQSNGRGLTAAIRSTVEGLLQKQIEIRSKAGHGNTLLKVESIPDVKPKALLTKSDFTKKNRIRKSSENSQPETALVSEMSGLPDTMSFPDLISNQISVRLALPYDDIAIANLRLSVFSDFSEELRRQFCQRSCEVLNRRRQNGASCLVARGCSPLNRADVEVIVGSVECSTHEFIHTELGRRRPGGTIMYITEVAVSPDSRRNGVGTLLLKAVDQFANLKKMETIYLHVDVENAAACELYKKAGYKILDSTNHIYSEFTTVLNLHDGATKGRRHYLLHKILTENQTWLPPFVNRSTIGFDIA